MEHDEPDRTLTRGMVMDDVHRGGEAVSDEAERTASSVPGLVGHAHGTDGQDPVSRSMPEADHPDADHGLAAVDDHAAAAGSMVAGDGQDREAVAAGPLATASDGRFNRMVLASFLGTLFAGVVLAALIGAVLGWVRSGAGDAPRSVRARRPGRDAIARAAVVGRGSEPATTDEAAVGEPVAADAVPPEIREAEAAIAAAEEALATFYCAEWTPPTPSDPARV